MTPDLHNDAELFAASVNYTAESTGFSPRLVEKDYFCSLVLSIGQGGVYAFKGGTSLSKVHAEFYRLSEDLDFAASIPEDATKSDRSMAAAPFKKWFERVARSSCFTVVDSLRGFNRSKQYAGSVGYRSVVTGGLERIKIEVSLREPHLCSAEEQIANTLVMDPFRGVRAVEEIPIMALSLEETYAEKVRAAMTRKEPAIRDLFDIDYAVRAKLIDFGAKEFKELVRNKLAVAGNDGPWMDRERGRVLRAQVETELRPA